MNHSRSVACGSGSRPMSSFHALRPSPRGATLFVLGSTRPLHRDALKIGGGLQAIRYSALTAFINNSLLSIYCTPGIMLGSGHTAVEKRPKWISFCERRGRQTRKLCHEEVVG